MQNNLIIMRLTVNSKERKSDTLTGHLSSPSPTIAMYTYEAHRNARQIKIFNKFWEKKVENYTCTILCRIITPGAVWLYLTVNWAEYN